MASIAQADLNTNLIEYWNLNDNAATKTLLSGVGNNAALTTYNSDTTGSATSKIGGRSMYMNGGDYATYTVPSNLWSTDFTVTGWFRAESTASTIISIDDADSYPLYKLVWVPSTGYIQMQVTNTAGGIYNALTTTGISQNTWYFFEIVHTIANSSVYMKLNRENTYIAKATYTGTLRNTNAGYLGSRALGSQKFDGYLDAIGTWTRALTSSELDSVYNSATGIEYPFAPAGYSHKVNTLTVVKLNLVNPIKVNNK